MGKRCPSIPHYTIRRQSLPVQKVCLEYLRSSYPWGFQTIIGPAPQAVTRQDKVSPGANQPNFFFGLLHD